MTDQETTVRDDMVWVIGAGVIFVLLVLVGLMLLADFHQFLHLPEEVGNTPKTSQNYRRPFLGHIITGQELFLFNKTMRQNGLKASLG